MTRFGLNEDVIQSIQSIFRTYPLIEQAVLYGSRAKGTYHPGSDIDLTLFGPGLTTALLHAILNDLDDLNLPYSMDVSIVHQLNHPQLLEHIRRDGVVFYVRSDRSPSR